MSSGSPITPRDTHALHLTRPPWPRSASDTLTHDPCLTTDWHAPCTLTSFLVFVKELRREIGGESFNTILHSDTQCDHTCDCTHARASSSTRPYQQPEVMFDPCGLWISAPIWTAKIVYPVTKKSEPLKRGTISRTGCLRCWSGPEKADTRRWYVGFCCVMGMCERERERENWEFAF